MFTNEIIKFHGVTNHKSVIQRMKPLWGDNRSTFHKKNNYLMPCVNFFQFIFFLDLRNEILLHSIVKMAAVSSLLSNTILPIDHVKKSSKHRNLIHINIHSSRSVSRNNSNIETNRHELLKYQSRFISTSSTPSSSLNNDKENELIEQIDCSKSVSRQSLVISLVNQKVFIDNGYRT